MLHNRSFGGNLALKVDIRKALISVKRFFVLLDLIIHSSISIDAILKSAKLPFFFVNGNLVGFFSCKRRVRQGHPLSPLLLYLAENVLSRGISLLVQEGKLLPMIGPRGLQVPSHVFYVDDIMIFCKGNKKKFAASSE